MASLQEQLFVQVASRCLNRLTKDLQKKYEPKKGDRFNVKGITYEIGPPKFVNRAIQFEISSKIPGEELLSGFSQTKFFNDIKEICVSSGKQPYSADMENIVRETRDQERKERDYVKLTYQYVDQELYDDQEVLREVEEFAKSPDKDLPPAVAGATTVAARLILQRIEKSLYGAAQENIQVLIDANERVRGELKKAKK